MKSFILLLSLFFIGASTTRANNVEIKNVKINNNGPDKITVSFDVSWDNSWRINVGPENYDGAWVFFKYRTSGGKWEPLFLTGENNVIPSGFSVFQNTSTTGPPAYFPLYKKVGAMIYRDETNLGTGSVSAINVTLGLPATVPYNIDVRGMAIEMVYAPQPLVVTTGGTIRYRAFLGDGDGTNESIHAFHYDDNTATTTSLKILKCDPNTMDDAKLTNDGIYLYTNDTLQTTNPIGSLDPFPSMKPVWCMKYELSQAGYRDFLNTLDATQQATRTDNAPTSVRGTPIFTAPVIGNYIVIDVPATGTSAAVFSCNRNGNNVHNESTDGEWDVCTMLKWTDLAAFLDWSGLAPMTEIQYERLARGVSSAGANPAILGEFAWGDATITNGSYTLTNAGAENELASNASTTLGNANYGLSNTTAVSLRNGIFATSTSNRRTSGASYYGIMELSGSVNEYCISLGNVAGRSCKYVPNGDGIISELGNAKLPTSSGGFWPGMEGNLNLSSANTCVGTCEVTSFAGIRLRGGGSSDPVNVLSISDRSQVFIPTLRAGSRGGRGVLNIR